jgi:hypothetical protein
VLIPTTLGRNQDEHASGTMPCEHEAESRGVTGQPHVHRERHGRPDPDRRTIDRPDHRLRARIDPQRDQATLVAVRRSVPAPGRVSGEGLSSTTQVSAGAEAPTPTSDHDGPNVRVSVGAIECITQLALHRRSERVQAIGPIERDREDAVGQLGGDRGVSHAG